MRRW